VFILFFQVFNIVICEHPKRDLAFNGNRFLVPVQKKFKLLPIGPSRNVAIFFQNFAIFAQNTKNMFWNNPFFKWYLCEIKKILLVLDVRNSFKICYTWVVVVMSLTRA
jgi:hypothetical protein